MPSIPELVAIKESVEGELLARPGVTGVDVGYKVVGGEQTDEVAIRVHVEEKKADVPETERVPEAIDGVVTDVLERRYELQVAREPLNVAAQADTTHYATLQGGISMGPSRAIGGYVYTGTLGAVVTDNPSGQKAALTNFHVACVDDGWSVGDRQVQPSRVDTGTVPADEFGAILRAVLSSHVDGAVVSIDAGRATSNTVVEIGDVKGTATATLGMAVRKRGRTTGFTHGTVDGLSLTVNVDYGDGIGVRTLTDQVSIATDTSQNPLFSDRGDSGSVIVDSTGAVVALLFAGAGTSTVGNPISAVLSELDITIPLGKSIIKDIKDGRKDIIKDKDKELRKDVIKDKELRKDLIKDGKELKKELVVDGKQLKDIVDVVKKPDLPPIDPGDPGRGPGFGGLADRLSEIESRLGSLESFISSDERPDLTSSAFIGEAELTPEEIAALRAEAERQVADAAAAKSDLDNLLG